MYLPHPDQGAFALNESTYRLSNPNDYTIDRTYRLSDDKPALLVHVRHDAGSAETYSVDQLSTGTLPDFVAVDKDYYYDISGNKTTRYAEYRYVHTRATKTAPCVADNGTVSYYAKGESSDTDRYLLGGFRTIDSIDWLTDWTKTRDSNRATYRPNGGYYVTRALNAGGSRQVIHVHNVSGSVAVTNGYVSRSNVHMDVTIYTTLGGRFVLPVHQNTYRITYDVKRASGSVTVDEPAWVDTARTCMAENRSKERSAD